jgi:hypothetical protein
VDIENPHTFQNALDEPFNLFLGAGFSVAAKDRDGTPLPVGGALADELCSHFSRQDLRDALTLAQISQIFRALDSIKYDAYLKRRFTVSEFDPLYKVLEHLKIHCIFTTNIDDLAFRIYADSARYYINDIVQHGPSYHDRAAIEYCPLHGSVTHDNPHYSFTTIEVASAFSSSATVFQYLAKELSSRSTLFWGYGLEDAGVLQSISEQARSTSFGQNRWLVLREPTEPAVSYFRSLGFFIIKADTLSLLSHLSQNVPPPSVLSGTLRLSDFPSGHIPTIEKLSVHSSEDFFRGKAPSWYDILTSRVPRTSHYNRLADVISSRKSVLVQGIPACGKTTLLMQLACFYETKQLKLFEDYITPAKGDLIERAVAVAYPVVPGLSISSVCAVSKA